MGRRTMTKETPKECECSDVGNCTMYCEYCHKKALQQLTKNIIDEDYYVLERSCNTINNFGSNDTERLKELIRQIKSIIKTGKKKWTVKE